MYPTNTKEVKPMWPFKKKKPEETHTVESLFVIVEAELKDSIE